MAEKFFVMPEEEVMRENTLEGDDVITEIRVSSKIKQSANYEIYEKQSYDWPLVAAAVAQTDKGWNVVLGAVAPIPWRAAEAEKVLGSKAITPALAEEAAQAAIAGATPLRHNRYKLELVKAAVRRALLKASGQEVEA
jgi:xanthine dehydrogenase YagS FAD-binding subunit